MLSRSPLPPAPSLHALHYLSLDLRMKSDMVARVASFLCLVGYFQACLCINLIGRPSVFISNTHPSTHAGTYAVPTRNCRLSISCLELSGPECRPFSATNRQAYITTSRPYLANQRIQWVIESDCGAEALNFYISK